MASTDLKLAALEKYSACDVRCTIPSRSLALLTLKEKIADALLKLDVPGAGFLPDICTFPRSARPRRKARALRNERERERERG
jgi:hypothetical protein